METFTAAPCDTHKDTPSNYIALEHQIRRVCYLCPIEGNNYVISHQAFQSLALIAISDMLQSQNKAFRRYQELSEFTNQLKGNYSKDDDQFLQKIMKFIQDDSKIYKETYIKVQSYKNQLQTVKSMINYFKFLKNENLYEMKMNISSQQGLKRFYKKCRDYAALIKKGVHSEFKKIEQKMIVEENHLADLESQSFIFRLRECLISRKLAMMNLPSTPKSDGKEGKKQQLKN